MDHNTAACGTRDELRYCLRGLVANVPWLARIVLVTDGQWPAWLDEEAAAAMHPPIVRVDHSALHPAGASMYGALTIECVLHRIPNLTPRFFYVNADMFVTRPLARSDLLTPSGAGIFRVDETVTAPRYTRSADAAYAAWYNGRVDQIVLHARHFGDPTPTPAAPRHERLGAHQAQVLCKCCIAHCCELDVPAWREACDLVGRSGFLPYHPQRTAFELAALRRGHCVAVEDPDVAFYSGAAALRTTPDVLRRARLLCVNNVDDLTPAQQAHVHALLAAVFPVPLACEGRG